MLTLLILFSPFLAFLLDWFVLTQKDPKTSRWLWDIRERSRQKKRTEHYRSIIAMQQSSSFSSDSEGGEGGANMQVMEDMTRLTDKQQMSNFLTWGKWDLTDASIEKLMKDEERKERVSIFLVRCHPLKALVIKRELCVLCFLWVRSAFLWTGFSKESQNFKKNCFLAISNYSSEPRIKQYLSLKLKAVLI